MIPHRFIGGSNDDAFWNIIKKGLDDASPAIVANGGSLNYLRLVSYDNFAVRAVIDQRCRCRHAPGDPVQFGPGCRWPVVHRQLDHFGGGRGVLLTGGFGSVVGIFFGTITFAIVNQGIYYTEFDRNWSSLIIGVLLPVAVLMNNTFRKMALAYAPKKGAK